MSIDQPQKIHMVNRIIVSKWLSVKKVPFSGFSIFIFLTVCVCVCVGIEIREFIYDASWVPNGIFRFSISFSLWIQLCLIQFRLFLTHITYDGYTKSSSYSNTFGTFCEKSSSGSKEDEMRRDEEKLKQKKKFFVRALKLFWINLIFIWLHVHVHVLDASMLRGSDRVLYIFLFWGFSLAFSGLVIWALNN